MKLFFSNRPSEGFDLKTTFSFGRVEGDMTFPEDDVVSTRHGKFVVEGGKAFILDGGSTNGTFLNETRIPANQKIELQEGDHIQFGAQVVFFTLNDNYNPAVKEKAKSGKELLAQARRNKSAKIQELENKQTQANSNLQKLLDDLKSVEAKITLAHSAIEEIDKRHTEAASEAQRLETDKESIRKTIEDKKKPIYDQQATLKDKLKLMETTQAPELQKTPLREELSKVQEQLNLLENEKKNMPQKIIEYQKKCEVLQQKRTEYVAQEEKLKTALAERQAKYASEIEHLEDEIMSLDAALIRAKENLEK